MITTFWIVCIFVPFYLIEEKDSWSLICMAEVKKSTISQKVVKTAQQYMLIYQAFHKG
jgi:hypothetical protein